LSVILSAAKDLLFAGVERKQILRSRKTGSLRMTFFAPLLSKTNTV
jgi:hypothetical protein